MTFSLLLQYLRKESYWLFHVNRAEPKQYQSYWSHNQQKSSCVYTDQWMYTTFILTLKWPCFTIIDCVQDYLCLSVCLCPACHCRKLTRKAFSCLLEKHNKNLSSSWRNSHLWWIKLRGEVSRGFEFKTRSQRCSHLRKYYSHKQVSISLRFLNTI